MIRCLLTGFLIVYLGSSLVSCTPAQNTGYEDDLGGPIDEATEAGTEAGTESDDSADVASNEGAEDELEGELDQENAEQAQEATPAPQSDELEGVTADLGDEQPAPEPPAVVAEEAPLPVEEPAPAPAPKLAVVRDIRYLANANGGTVVIETDKPVAYQTRMNTATRQFVVEIADVELPASLQRPYALKDFQSRIGGINAYQTAGTTTARVVVQLNGASSSEPIVQQEGSALVVIPPAADAPVAVASAPAPTADTPRESAAKEGALAARTLDEFLTGNQKFYGKAISLQVKDADVRDVVNFLAEESGANVVMSDDVTGGISIKLRRVPWDQALVTVMRTKGLGYVRQGNVLRISTLKSLQGESEAASKILEAQKAITPSIVQVIPISYANLDDLSKSLAPFLSKDGKVVADNRTSTMIVTDKQDVVERVQRLIQTLDVPPAQVSIESKIVEATEKFENFVGVTWGFGGAPISLSSSGGAQGAPIDMNLGMRSASLSRAATGAGPLSAVLRVGTLDVFGDISAALSLAELDSLARVISSPRVSTMNREKAVIVQKSENISVITSVSDQNSRITKQEKRTPYALELTVTPQVTSDGGVIMDLDVKREFLGPIEDVELKARAVNTRSARTKVLVRNGQTAVIGGIYTSDELDAVGGVPGLRNIPILGWLFKNRSKLREKTELLIFLTPRILAMDDAAAGKPQTASR